MEILVSSRAIQNVVDGSYESVIEKVEKQATEQYGGFHLIATFSNHVILANKRGSFIRCEYMVENDGTVKFGQREDVDVPVLRPKSTKDFASEIIDEAVDNLIEGKVSEGRNHLRQLISSSELFDKDFVVQNALRGLEEMHGAKWIGFLNENREKITRFLWGSKGTYIKKFGRTYEGQIDESDILLKKKIDDDLNTVHEKIKEIRADIKENVNKFKNEGISKETVFDNFGEFVFDYFEHLKSLCEIMEEINGANTYNDKACAFNFIVEQFSDIKLGGELIKKVFSEIF